MMKILILIAVATALSTSVFAGSLKDYKKTKMENRTQVSSENCVEEFLKACTDNCSKDRAEQACKERDKRHTKKTLETIAKGATLGAGAVAVALDKPMPTVILDPNGTTELSPYAIIWNKPSFIIEGGGGLLESGTKLANVSAIYRSERFGFGANADYLWDGSDSMTEMDIGPTVNFASASFIFTVQPSFLVTMGSGEKNVYGGGIRTYTNFLMGPLFLFFNPELGYINKKWAYDLKLGIGYRFTPSTFMDFGYSYRDVVDFKDFNISSAHLQGALFRIGYRFN
jgi:hypothetical protein